MAPWGEWQAKDVSSCHAKREKSGLGDRFCVGQSSPTDDPRFLGCRYAMGVRLWEHDGVLADREAAEWWKFGTLDPDEKSFIVDKEEILRIVETRSARAPCSSCPAWSMDRVRAVVKLLPGVLKIGEYWKLRYSALNRNRVIGVEPVFPASSFTLKLPDEGEE